MKKQTLLLLLLIGLTYSAQGQIDYLDYKERYYLSCGTPDSSEVVRNQLLVDSLDNFEIVNGRQQFLYDRGWVYYLRYLKWKDKKDLEIAATCYEQGWIEYQDLSALWNLVVIFKALGDCEKAIKMVDLYIDTIPENKTVDYQSIYYIYKNCWREK